MTVQNREQPWLRRPEWAAGRIEHSSKGSMVGVWVMALVLLLMPLPLMFKLREEVLEKENYPALAGLLFPLVGVVLLIQATRLTVRFLRFGRSVVELSRVPGLVGGPVAGTIHTRLDREAVGNARVSLRSIHRTVRRNNGKREVSERIVWEGAPANRGRTANRRDEGRSGAVFVSCAFRIPRKHRRRLG